MQCQIRYGPNIMYIGTNTRQDTKFLKYVNYKFQETNLQHPSLESYKDGAEFEKDGLGSHFPYHSEVYH